MLMVMMLVTPRLVLGSMNGKGKMMITIMMMTDMIMMIVVMKYDGNDIDDAGKDDESDNDHDNKDDAGKDNDDDNDNDDDDDKNNRKRILL